VWKAGCEPKSLSNPLMAGHVNYCSNCLNGCCIVQRYIAKLEKPFTRKGTFDYHDDEKYLVSPDNMNPVGAATPI
jgi:hypothetical protein